MNELFLVIENLVGGKNLWALPLCYLAGIILSFTPCSLPMVPVILGIAGVQEKLPKNKALLISWIFILGLVVMNIFLGILAALFGVFFGSISKLIVVRLLFAIFFIILGLATVGILPLNLSTNFNFKLKTVGFLGVFLLGVLCGAAINTCMFPVLGAILLFVANKQDVMFGAIALAFFSLGIGTVYLAFILLSKKTFDSLRRYSLAFNFLKKIIGVLILLFGVYLIYKLRGI